MSPQISLLLVAIGALCVPTQAHSHYFRIPRFECCTSYDDRVEIVQVCVKGMNKRHTSDRAQEECWSQSKHKVGLTKISCMTPMCKEVGWSFGGVR